ncbi:S24/S26 family peptidase, partial [Bartonella bilalgolemii]
MIKQFVVGFTLCFLASACCILFALSQGFRVNYSHSAPRGLWKVNYFQKDLKKGRFMEVCPPDVPLVKMFVDKGYLHSGVCPSGSIPFLKPLVAVSVQGTQITLYEHVNRKQFIKQSIANIASIFGLKSSGLKAFGVLV